MRKRELVVLIKNRIKLFEDRLGQVIDNLQTNKWSVNYCEQFVLKEYCKTVGYINCSRDAELITYEQSDEYLRITNSKYDAIKRHLQTVMLKKQKEDEESFYRIKKR